MTTVATTFSVQINAKPDKVFAYVSDLTRHPEWSGGQLKIQALSNGPVAVGSQYRSQGEVLNEKERPNELRVTEYSPSSRFSFVAKDPGFGDVTHEFAFKAQSGGTLMERTVTSNLPALMAFMFRTFIFPLVGKPQMDKALAKLKAIMEK
jgi:uncharacterized protein YndB with AHSA1/START domain